MKHTKNRVAALLLALAMVLSLMPAAFAADEYPEGMPAETDASYAAVKSAYDNKIMTGENGNMNLEGSILRSTVSKMVVTAFAAKGEADLSSFGDVDSDAWYAEWMAKANQMGIMTGTSGKMNPNNEVTLAEVAAMLARALGLEPGSADDLKDIPGADSVNAWAIPYVAALVKAGYLSDVTGAHAPMTRVAFAEVIYKATGEGNYVAEGEITEDQDGTIVITADGVSLKGITVKGDVIIADGVDAGSINLDGVKIEGRLVIRGGSSVELKGSSASATVIAKTSDEITVKADTTSDTGAIAVAGTNGKAAEKVTLDMPEPNATISTDTAVAIQNANGGTISMESANVSVTVESGTLDEVAVSDGMESAKIEVAEGATIEKVTTNTDITITGEGKVEEKAGTGKVTDAEGNEVAGSDEPVEVPTVSTPADTNAPTNPTHKHEYGNATPFDANRHSLTCSVEIDTNGNVKPATQGQEGDAPAVTYKACGAVTYESHKWETTETNGKKVTTCSECNAVKPADPTTTTPDEGAAACNGPHIWENIDDSGNKTLSCVQDGVQKQQCKNTVVSADPTARTQSRCTATRTITTPATGHNLVADQATAPTCKEDGKQTFKCTNAGCKEDLSSKTTVLKATGNHTWKQNGAVAATCTTDGHYVYVCTTCETEDTSKIIAKNPNAHVWGTDATHVEGTNTHTYACTVDGCGGDAGAATKTETCTLAPKTGEESGYEAPTCTTAGKAASQACSKCDNVVEGKELPATGHSPESGWTVAKDGSYHVKTCKSCDTEISGTKTEHKGDSCAICGWVKGSGSTGDGGETEDKCTDADHQNLCPGQTCQKCKQSGVGKAQHDYKGGTKGTAGTCTKCKTATCPASNHTGESCSCGWSKPDAAEPGAD